MPASLRPLAGLLIVLVGTMAAPLDSAVNVAFPSITGAFGRQVQDIRWVVIAYVMTYSSLLLIFGKLSDLIGYRIVFRAGLVITALGFAWCSYATTFELLVLARVLQGIGVALILSCAPALATTLYSENERTRILGVYAAMTALGAAIGPLVGGLLVERFGWSVVFWARIPLVLGALVFSGLIPARPGHGSPSGLDPIGSLQLAVALCAILLGLSVRVEAIGMALPLGIVGLGIALLAAFVRRQSRRAQPIIRPSLFRDPTFTLMNLASIIANFAAFSIVFIGPFFLISIFHFNASQAGLVLAVNALGMIIGASVAPRLIRRIGGSRVASAGLAMSAVGLLGVAAWTVDVPVLVMVTPLVIQGLGIGLFQVAYTDLVTATLPVADRGVAGSLTMVTRTVGVVSGASGHAALHRYFEGAAVDAGATGIQPFMAGFQAVFVVAAGVQVLAIAGGGLLSRYAHRKDATREDN